jgi:hypothetical protein
MCEGAGDYPSPSGFSYRVVCGSSPSEGSANALHVGACLKSVFLSTQRAVGMEPFVELSSTHAPRSLRSSARRAYGQVVCSPA